MQALVMVDIINLILALIAIGVFMKIVLRTEKGLDKVFKFLTASIIVKFLSTLFTMNEYMGIIQVDISRIAYHISRLLILTLTIIAGVVMLKVIQEESNK